MKKILAYGGLILLFLLLQCSFFVHLSLADVVPNLLIILTASIAIINGMYAFGYMLCGYLTGIGNRLFYKEDLTFPVLMIAAADLFYGFYMYVFGFMIRGRLNVLFYLRRIILPEAVYTVIIAVFLYRIILLITEHLEKKGSENLIV